ncbi:N-acyl homoserine lactonase family protein [Actinomadura rugatobispora]|uniref:N-acyl homoserine lactonase family protein n=1 Tax=Actinomadura rugatobispora TaxID=1994 RepID=A0ABW1A514_9ACTN
MSGSETTTTATAATTAHEVYAIKFGQHPGGKHGDYFYGSAAEPMDRPVQLDYFVWLIRSPGHDIVVDAGFTAETAARRRREHWCAPSEALAGLGTDCAAVPYVILSHFHYDHVGDLGAFTDARFVVQGREMAFWTGRHAARREFRRLVERDDIERLAGYGLDGRLLYVDGEHEVVPGVRVHHVGGHTAGMQIVSVATGRGTVVLAADASHLYANVEDDAPFGVLTELPAMYDTFDLMRRLAGSPELIVPGHDPEVLTRFEPVDGLEGRAVRIA